MFAPIVIFSYSRKYHLQQTIESLLKNPEAAKSDLIIFSDAARSIIDQAAVLKVREYIAAIKGFKSITIYNQKQNFGLAKSIIEGVTKVLEDYERIIVLEDDLVVSPYFLSFMNNALELYAEDHRVISIHGYIYPVKKTLPKAFFLRGADCWGWATWRRGWALFDPDAKFLLSELKRNKLIKKFDYDFTYNFSGMLKGVIKGTLNSWAVRWYASAFLANKLTLYPGKSLVQNIGCDGSGTHCHATSAFDSELSKNPITIDNLTVMESDNARVAITNFFREQQTFLRRLLAKYFFIKIKFIEYFVYLVKSWSPPALLLILRQMINKNSITFDGPYLCWENAKKRSSGYDCEKILEKVLKATIKVKEGKAIFERDSVIYNEIQYDWNMQAALMWGAARNNGNLSVLDFGGSLGSVYFQSRKFFEGLKSVRWSIVEQSHFVEAGKLHIQDNQLTFYSKIKDCVRKENPNIVLLSSVFHYLEKPFEILQELIDINPDLIIINKTPFYDGLNDFILRQNVPKFIYSASYPMWVFAEDKFLTKMLVNFDLINKELLPDFHILRGASNFNFVNLLFKKKL
jgi:putative methyltransferase (TIGR04325 family)